MQILFTVIDLSVKVGMWLLDVLIRSIDFVLGHLPKPLHVLPLANMPDLPNHAICYIVDNILGGMEIRSMDSSTDELTSPKLTCRGLRDPISELLFHEGHLFFGLSSELGLV